MLHKRLIYILLFQLLIQLILSVLLMILFLHALNTITITSLTSSINRITSRFIIQNDNPEKDGSYWVNEMIQGGYIIHLRHADRLQSQDIHGYDYYEFKTRDNSLFSQFTCLSDEGISQSKLLNWGFSSHGIVFQDIYTSPSCRSIETTQFITNQYVIEDSIMYISSIHQNDREIHKEKLEDFLFSINTNSNFNTLIVGHEETVFPWGGFNIIDHTDGKKRMQGGFSIMKFNNESNTLEILHTFSSISEFLKSSKTTLNSN